LFSVMIVPRKWAPSASTRSWNRSSHSAFCQEYSRWYGGSRYSRLLSWLRS
jgi:uncharacterized protein YukE